MHSNKVFTLFLVHHSVLSWLLQNCTSQWLFEGVLMFYRLGWDQRSFFLVFFHWSVSRSAFFNMQPDFLFFKHCAFWFYSSRMIHSLIWLFQWLPQFTVSVHLHICQHYLVLLHPISTTSLLSPFQWLWKHGECVLFFSLISPQGTWSCFSTKL